MSEITNNPQVPSQIVEKVTFPQFINQLGIIPTTYKNAMSYYETLAWLCKYLEETVIPTVNQNGEAVEELQGLYIELNQYVTNYFDNLDVQEEINNKLDELASNGYLESLVRPYIETYIQPQITEIANNVNNQINRFDVLEGRVDQITQLPEGSTSGDAELADIRVDNAGYTYSTAGDSVRGQTSYNEDIFNNTLNDILDVNVNELNRVEKESNYYYNNGSNKSANNTTSCFSKIKVNNNDVIYYKRIFGYYSWFIPNTTGIPEKMDERVTNSVDGNFTCTDNGYLYISISNLTSNPIITKSKEMYDSNIATNYYKIKDSMKTKSTSLKNILPILKTSGFIYNTYSFRYTQANGGTVSEEVLTIPSGNTGYSSSIARQFNVNNFITSDNELYVITGVKTTNYDDYLISFIYQGGSAYITNELIADYTENNIHYYVHKLNYSNNYPIGVFIVAHSQEVLANTATIEFDDCYILTKYNALNFEDKIFDIESYINDHGGFTVNLDVGEDKDYTSLRTALEYAQTNYSPSIKYVVRLFYDEYDVSDDITDSDLSNLSFVGLQVRKNTKIIGMNNQLKNKIKLELTSETASAIRERVSPINLFDNAELENLTIESDYCRYSVHDDFRNNPTESEKIKTIKNCIFKSTNSYYDVCYGAGLTNGSKWLFENCTFIAGTNDTRPFTCHNATTIDTPTSIEFKNCKFEGSGSVRLGSLNNGTDIIVNCIINNCYLESSLLLNEESAGTYGAGCKFNIIGSCNNIGNTDITITTTDSVDYSDRKNLINKIS